MGWVTPHPIETPEQRKRWGGRVTYPSAYRDPAINELSIGQTTIL